MLPARNNKNYEVRTRYDMKKVDQSEVRLNVLNGQRQKYDKSGLIADFGNIFPSNIKNPLELTVESMSSKLLPCIYSR